MLPIFSENSTALLLDLIQERTGHACENGKCGRILDKITPLVIERGFDSLLDYYYLLKYGEEAEDEWRRVENALAVNETYFWREYDQIRITAEVLVPELQREKPGVPVRIWHAACATGEEPYSMAIALTEAGCYNAGPIEIIATDFNKEAIALARAAVYRKRSFRTLPDPILQRYFQPEPGDRYRLADNLRTRVHFLHLNLLNASGMQQMQNFNIIFCRNAFIYFSPASIKQVVESFFQSLRAPGILFTAASESLLQITTLFDLVEIGGAFGYQALGDQK